MKSTFNNTTKRVMALGALLLTLAVSFGFNAPAEARHHRWRNNYCNNNWNGGWNNNNWGRHRGWNNNYNGYYNNYNGYYNNGYYNNGYGNGLLGGLRRIIW
ncbi:MAG: hypothetical protein J0H83_03025 [Candidatus Melainabacteria bacterium]|jgi:hypothetical protein|nr:hypothetical protein [Candidatus Melainabacteria bacterium]